MDVHLARTFLGVVTAGNFVGAAERLHVTQSTVSMRIRALEEQLGRRLFERGRSGAQLTPAGMQFQRHAAAFLRIWEQARHDVVLPLGYSAVLAVGGQFSLWDGLLLGWVRWMKHAAPAVALRTESGTSAQLMRGLGEGTLDIGVMYHPENRIGFEVDKLVNDTLVLVSTDPALRGGLGDDYIYVDWGADFRTEYLANYPNAPTPGLFFGLGSLALPYLLDGRGSGHFPLRLVRPYLASGELHLVPDEPVFSHPAYIVYAADRDDEAIGTAIDGLHRVADLEIESPPS